MIVFAELEKKLDITKEETDSFYSIPRADKEKRFDLIRNILTSRGYDSIKYFNRGESFYNIQIIVINNKNIEIQ